MRASLVAVAVCAIATPAVAQNGEGARDPAVTVQIKDAKGKSVGTVEVRQLENGTVFIADLRGLPPGAHGFHLHERGACDPPSFKSAGGHYNPRGTAHGFDSPKGPHAGDLPNIHVTPRGTARAELFSPRVTLERSGKASANEPPFPLLDRDGSAIVIHAEGDDYQDSDSAGERIACGVIAKPRN